MKPKFITFEGSDGSGKTTQSKELYKYLKSTGEDVIWTREIGGTDIAEKIRDIVVYNEIERFSELFLIMAARIEHIEKVIKPAINENKIVICDRFVDSSVAYQSYNKEDINIIYNLHRDFCDNILPDITFYLQITPEKALKRTVGRDGNNKFEMKESEYFRRVIDNYNYIAELNYKRFRVINADNTIENISKIIKSII